MEKSNKKRYILNLAVMVTVLIAIVVYLCKNGTITLQTLMQIKWYDYLFLTAFYLSIFLFLAFIEMLIYKTFCVDFTYSISVKNTFVGNLGSIITPFKSGHFPLKLYAQHNSGIKTSDSVIGCVKCQIIFSLTSLLVYLVLTVCLGIFQSKITINSIQVSLFIVSGIGFAIHLFVFVFLITIAFNQNLQNKILALWVKIISKIKKKTNGAEYEKSKREKLMVYKEQLTIIGKNFTSYLLPSFAYAVFMLLRGSGQYIAYLLISKSPFSVNALFTFYIFDLTSTYIVNLLPLPGGVGGAEMTFKLIYSLIIPDTLIGAVLVLWRVCSAYILIIIDLIFFAVVVFMNKKSSRKISRNHTNN